MSPDKRKSPTPLLYLYGEEDYLIEEAISEIKAGAFPPEGGFDALNYHLYWGKTLAPEEVITAAMTLPAFSPLRVVVVRDANALKADREKLFLEYAGDPSPTTCLVLIANTKKVDKRSKLFKYLAEKGWTRSCSRMRAGELPGWVKREAAGEGKRITPEAAKRLVEIAGPGLREIKSELDKVIIFAGSRDTVDLPDVEGCGIDVREETVFGLADAIGRKDATAALKILGKLSSEQPVNVLGAIARQFRILLKIKTLLRKGVPQAKLQSTMGIFPTYFRGYLESCGRFTESELLRAHARVSATDLTIKSSPLPRGLVMSGLVIELCSPRGS
ncbi:MAG: DNA polymerase III subunit delta [Thermodesulfobacteriota bacterium]